MSNGILLNFHTGDENMSVSMANIRSDCSGPVVLVKTPYYFQSQLLNSALSLLSYAETDE